MKNWTICFEAKFCVQAETEDEARDIAQNYFNAWNMGTADIVPDYVEQSDAYAEESE